MRQFKLPVILMHPFLIFSSLFALLSVVSGCALTPTSPAPAQSTNFQPEEVDSVALVRAEQKAIQVETPIEQPRKDVWLRILDQFSMDLDIENERIAAQRNWYAKHPDYLERVSKRAEPYLYYIAEQIDVRNIPGEMALLPIVESAFDPFAYSHGRASGVWQFIPSTGTYFGLKQDWWYDGRRDIRAATNAALDYLTKLAGQFDGDWQLALASYNGGGGTIRKAIRKNTEKGLPTDFWSLKLRKETHNYVPKLIALAQLLREPEKYGVRFAPIENQPYFSVVKTGGQIDLSQVASLARLDIEEVYRLNPGYNRWATHPAGPHEVLVPVANETTLIQALADLPESERVKWNRYKVRAGDNLSSLSKKFRTTAKVIRQANDLNSNAIRIGQTLLIPSALKSTSDYSHSATERLDRKKVARQPKNTYQGRHTVTKGETFWSVSRTYGVTVKQLAHWNGMAPGDPIRPGQHLTLWLKNKQQALSSRKEIRQVNYRVRSGDSLSSIAGRFNVSIGEIRKWNPPVASAKYLQPGQKLTLYVNVVR